MVRSNGHAPLTSLPARSLAYQALSQGLIYPDTAWLADLPAWQAALVQALAPLRPDEQPLAAALALSGVYWTIKRRIQMQETLEQAVAAPEEER